MPIVFFLILLGGLIILTKGSALARLYMLSSNTVLKKIINFPPLILLAVILISQPLYAQEKGTVRGVVKDSLSLESLPFGNVFIKELNVGTSTNNRGYFVIPSVPANKNLTVVVSYVGYKKGIKSIS